MSQEPRKPLFKFIAYEIWTPIWETLIQNCLFIFWMLALISVCGGAAAWVGYLLEPSHFAKVIESYFDNTAMRWIALGYGVIFGALTAISLTRTIDSRRASIWNRIKTSTSIIWQCAIAATFGILSGSTLGYILAEGAKMSPIAVQEMWLTLMDDISIVTAKSLPETALNIGMLSSLAVIQFLTQRVFKTYNETGRTNAKKVRKEQE